VERQTRETKGAKAEKELIVDGQLIGCTFCSLVKCGDYTPYYYEICSIIMATLAVRRV